MSATLTSPTLHGSTEGAKPGSRVLQLDILRGLAILGVLGIHSPAVRGESGILQPLDALLHQAGWTGVDLFFVLSGYLIGGLLFGEIRQHGRLDVRRFLVRRMLRIWPPFYCLLAFVFIRMVIEANGDVANTWSALWPSAVHIQNFLGSPRPQLWSLAIEEHFYLFLPFFLWLATRKRDGAEGIPAVPKMCAILTIGCLGLRTLLAVTTTIDVRAQTYLSMDALFFGVYLAYLKAYQPDVLSAIAKRRSALLIVGTLLLLPAILTLGLWRRTAGFTGLYLGYAMWLICLVHVQPDQTILSRLLRSRPARLVALIGANSYSIYLWHYDTSFWTYRFGVWVGTTLHLPGAVTWTLHTLAYMAWSVIAGIVLGRLIEGPVQIVRERLYPRVAPTVVTETAAIYSTPEPLRL